MRSLRLMVGIAAVLVALPALAHGTFLDARPLPGVAVGGEVEAIEMLFPEPVVLEGVRISVEGPDGPVASTGAVTAPTETVIRTPIEQLDTPGSYMVTYEVPAVDGFVFEGSYPFEFDPQAPPIAPLPFGNDPLPVVIIGVGVLAVTMATVATTVAWRRRQPD